MSERLWALGVQLTLPEEDAKRLGFPKLMPLFATEEAAKEWAERHMPGQKVVLYDATPHP